MITRLCKKCSSYHEIFYVIQENGTKHMMIICGKNRTYLPYEAGLDLRYELTRKEKNRRKIVNTMDTIPLF